MRRIYKSLFLLLLFFVLPLVIKAQLNRIDKPFISKNLSGIILNPNEEPIKNCSIERLESGWKKLIESRTTDRNGRFTFPKKTSGTFYLRVSCAEFQIYEIKVITRNKSRGKIRLLLSLAI